MSDTTTAVAPPVDAVARPREQRPFVLLLRRAWRQTRTKVGVALVVLASVAALVGGVTLYLREEVLDSHAFADRAVEALHQPTVRHVVAREITVQVIEPSFPDTLAGRPVISTAVRIAVTSPPFARVFRLAALHGHRLLFQRNGGNAVFDIADAGKVVGSALRNLSPKLARDLPPTPSFVRRRMRMGLASWAWYCPGRSTTARQDLRPSSGAAA